VVVVEVDELEELDEVDVVVSGNVLVVVVATSVVLVDDELDDVVVEDVVVEDVVVEDVVVEDVVEVVCETPFVVNALSGTISQPAPLIFQANIKQVLPPCS